TKTELYKTLKKVVGNNIDTITAIVCYNDEIGLEVVTVCSELNIYIPHDLSIIGQDNSYIAQNANIKLPTLPVTHEQLVRDAAEWIIEKIRGVKTLADEIYYEPVLIKGETIKKL